MPIPSGAYYRTRTYASGKKVRLLISARGQILEATPVGEKTNKTKTGKRLAKRRRRISR